MTEIQHILFNYQDQKYADFISKLVPTVPKQNFIGIRSPVYKKIIKEIKSFNDNNRKIFKRITTQISRGKLPSCLFY